MKREAWSGRSAGFRLAPWLLPAVLFIAPVHPACAQDRELSLLGVEQQEPEAPIPPLTEEEETTPPAEEAPDGTVFVSAGTPAPARPEGWSIPNGRRPNIDTLSATDRARLRDLMVAYITVEVLQGHVNIVHTGATLLTGHQLYLRDMETYLSANGGGAFVPLPRWDPATPIPEEFRGVSPVVFRGRAGEALRNTDIQHALPREFRTPGLCNYRTAAELGNAIDGWHGTGHVRIGGAMGILSHAPAAPIFWLYHGYIDDIYWQWQSCNGGTPRAEEGGHHGGH